jgi:chaperonin GroEL (HSP60 family)
VEATVAHCSEPFSSPADAERMEVKLDDPFILIYEKMLSNMKDLLPVLEQVARGQALAGNSGAARQAH